MSSAHAFEHASYLILGTLEGWRHDPHGYQDEEMTPRSVGDGDISTGRPALMRKSKVLIGEGRWELCLFWTFRSLSGMLQLGYTTGLELDQVRLVNMWRFSVL